MAVPGASFPDSQDSSPLLLCNLTGPQLQEFFDGHKETGGGEESQSSHTAFQRLELKLLQPSVSTSGWVE